MNLPDVSNTARLRFLAELPDSLRLDSWECAYLAPGYFQVKALVVTADGLGRIEVQGTGKTADDALDVLLSGTHFR